MNEENEMHEAPDAVVTVMEDEADESKDNTAIGGLAYYIDERMSRAEQARQPKETTWQSANRMYIGKYDENTKFRNDEKSRAYIKVGKSKVIAAFNASTKVLLGDNKFPLSVEETLEPTGIAEAVHIDPKAKKSDNDNEPQDQFGFEGDGKTLEPGALGIFADKLEGIEGVEEGEGRTPSAATFRPASASAAKMEKRIHDSLEESSARSHLRRIALDSALYGTGVMQGPFAIEREYPRFTEEGKYEPLYKTEPRVEHVPLWDFYPDPDAISLQDCTYVIRRRKMSRHQLRALKKRPMFRDTVIEQVIATGENYVSKSWETALSSSGATGSIERFEVLEYWGTMDAETASNADLELPKEIADDEDIQINAWTCAGRIIRLVINPFTPKRIPFFAVPHEVDPYSMFGVGVAENMEDSQEIMNGMMRMAVDNSALSGNVVLEVDSTLLVPGQDLDVYPGKVFERMGGVPGQALSAIQIPNVTNQNLQLFDKARQLADESTGIASFSHGQTGVSGIGRTASGISMLMNAAEGSTASVIKNYDDYLLKPLGEAMFAFLMQFDFDKSIKGDLSIKARGTDALIQKEVQSQRILMLLQVAQGPTLAPHARFPYLLQELAKTLGIDPEKSTNSPAEATAQALLMQQTGMMGHNGGPPMQGGPQGGVGPNDQTGGGGGQIAPGTPTAPGEDQFTGGPANG